MNEKVIGAIGIVIVVVIAITCSGGCRTSGGVVAQDVLEHQRRVTELESENEQLRSRLGKYDGIVSDSIRDLEGIGQRAAEMGSDIDILIRDFAEYNRIVFSVIAQLRGVQSEAGNTE